LSKKVVAVVFGGRSVEHEISLLSAKSILSKIDKRKYKIFSIFIEKNGTWRRAYIDNWVKGGDLIIHKDSFLSPSLNPDNPVFYEIKNKHVIGRHKLDVIFPVLHGTYGEDGTVQGLFKLMDVPFVGASVLGSSIGMDKIAMKTIFKQSGLPVVDFIGFYRHDWKNDKSSLVSKILKEIGPPCFVKSGDLGSSVGITKVKSVIDLERAIDYSCNFSDRIIIEKAVIDPREIEISVLGNDDPIASLPGEIIPTREFYDYAAKYTEEGTELVAPVKLSENVIAKLKTYAIKAFKSIDCDGMGRVDFLLERKTGKIFVSEINTIPGFTQISMYPKLWEVSGIKYKQLISRLIELALEKNKKSKKLSTDYKINL